jgi:uncharacterized protein YwgA
MTYITIDTKTRQAKKFVELIETLPFAKILKDPNVTTKKAIEDARKGKTKKYRNIKELISSLNS